MGRPINGSIVIDGSHGEGGGQILRTALALSAIIQVPTTVHHIRAGRKEPGLQPQHAKAVEALTRITGARIEGLGIGSQSIAFAPRTIQVRHLGAPTLAWSHYRFREKERREESILGSRHEVDGPKS